MADFESRPAVPSADAIRQLLAERVDDYRLSPGLVVGTSDQGERQLVSLVLYQNSLDSGRTVHWGRLFCMVGRATPTDRHGAADRCNISLRQGIQDLARVRR